jgi:hypothetical protein
MMTGLAQGIGSGSKSVQDAMSDAFGGSTMLENAIGQKQATEIFANVAQYAKDAIQSLQQTGVSSGNTAYDIAKMVLRDSELNSGVGISAFRDDIDALVAALGATGAGYLYGKNAKEGLSGTSDYLGALMGSITAGQTSPTAPGTTTGGTASGGDVLEVLKAILAALMKNGQIDQNGFDNLGGMLARMSDPRYGALVSNTAGLAR